MTVKRIILQQLCPFQTLPFCAFSYGLANSSENCNELVARPNGRVFIANNDDVCPLRSAIDGNKGGGNRGMYCLQRAIGTRGETLQHCGSFRCTGFSIMVANRYSKVP